MNKLISVLSVCVLATTVIYADPVTVPNTFTAGTPAKASEVNANFEALTSAINVNKDKITTLESIIAPPVRLVRMALGANSTFTVPILSDGYILRQVFSRNAYCSFTIGGDEITIGNSISDGSLSLLATSVYDDLNIPFYSGEVVGVSCYNGISTTKYPITLVFEESKAVSGLSRITVTPNSSTVPKLVVTVPSTSVDGYILRQLTTNGIDCELQINGEAISFRRSGITTSFTGLSIPILKEQTVGIACLSINSIYKPVTFIFEKR